MAEWSRFPNAPITEALLDIRVRLAPNVDLARLEQLQDAIRERYPARRIRRRWHSQFGIKGETVEVAPSAVEADGFIFVAADGRQLVQARLDGFTFNKLKPYDKWEPFRAEAQEHWMRYRAIAMPEIVTRIALRYINRIEIPLPISNFRDYILTTPEIAPGLPQGLKTFFMRLEIPDSRGAVAIVTETIESPEKRDSGTTVLPLILDIDVILEKEFAPDSGLMWDEFERLRVLKNEMFFRSLTDRAKELFR